MGWTARQEGSSSVPLERPLGKSCKVHATNQRLDRGPDIVFQFVLGAQFNYREALSRDWRARLLVHIRAGF